MKQTKILHSPARRITLIVLTVFLFAAAAAVVVLLLIPQIKITNYESALSMDDSPTAAYSGLMPDTETVYSWAADLVSLGARQPGTEAGEAAQQYVADQFEEFGLSDVQIIASDTSLYQCTDYSLTVNNTSYDCRYMRYTGITWGSYGKFTNEITAELVYVGDGTESDFSKTDVAGKIVVYDFELTEIPIIGAKLISYLFYDPNETLDLLSSKVNPYGGSYMDAYTLALENGAVGFIGVLTNYADSAVYNNENLAYENDYRVELPGLWVSNSTGDALKAAIREGDATASLTLSGSYSEVQAGAVVGFVYGQSDETIMVQSHYDSVTDGAAEDASGCAAMMAIAALYAQIPAEDLGRTVMFVAMDTHFTDYDSHDAFIEAFLGEDSNIICNLCVEHIALEAKISEDGGYELTGEVDPRIVFISDNDVLIDITSEELIRHGMNRSIILSATTFGDEVPTDAGLYYDVGVPIINIISGPLYLYDEADTIDKIAKDELVPTAETFSDILMRLMDLPLADFS